MRNNLPKVLLIAGDCECGSLEENLHGLAEITIAQSIHETLHTLNSDDFDVLFCPWEIKGCGWSDFTGLLKNVRPGLPIVIYYHCGGEPEWTEVLEAGAFDLLAPPFKRQKAGIVITECSGLWPASAPVSLSALVKGNLWYGFNLAGRCCSRSF
jgi:DNA-binding NtrC family response regulator